MNYYFCTQCAITYTFYIGEERSGCKLCVSFRSKNLYIPFFVFVFEERQTATEPRTESEVYGTYVERARVDKLSLYVLVALLHLGDKAKNG